MSELIRGLIMERVLKWDCDILVAKAAVWIERFLRPELNFGLGKN